jgi:hypothetical protein
VPLCGGTTGGTVFYVRAAAVSERSSSRGVVWSSDRRTAWQSRHLLFIRSKECDRIPCETDILLQTQPQCQRQRSKHELDSTTVHRVCAFDVLFACAFYVLCLYVPLFNVE